MNRVYAPSRTQELFHVSVKKNASSFRLQKKETERPPSVKESSRHGFFYAVCTSYVYCVTVFFLEVETVSFPTATFFLSDGGVVLQNLLLSLDTKNTML